MGYPSAMIWEVRFMTVVKSDAMLQYEKGIGEIISKRPKRSHDEIMHIEWRNYLTGRGCSYGSGNSSNIHVNKASWPAIRLLFTFLYSCNCARYLTHLEAILLQVQHP